MEVVTATAPVNIAVIKYWGKRDEDLVLPVNTSISVTLDQQQLLAKTTVAVSKDFTSDQIWLNGKEESMNNPRIQNLLKEVKRRARKRKSPDDQDFDSIFNWKLHICSVNNFPTAAGLASSAAGYACMAYALSKLYGLEESISTIARRGSGSACRSVYGGFVAWDKGEKEDGSDSVARQIATELHWPELRIMILVISDQQKLIGSSLGMQTTIATSDLMQQRIKSLPHRVTEMETAIIDRDFQTFAKLTMKDSNQLHAVCLDTYPPISYMTDTSHHICRLVHCFNDHCGEIKVAYTFDAGPNACLYLLEQDVPRVLSLIHHVFKPTVAKDFVQGLALECRECQEDDVQWLPEDLKNNEKLCGAVQYIIYTKPGPGPQTMKGQVHRLLTDDGLPKTTVASVVSEELF